MRPLHGLLRRAKDWAARLGYWGCCRRASAALEASRSGRPRRPSPTIDRAPPHCSNAVLPRAWTMKVKVAKVELGQREGGDHMQRQRQRQRRWVAPAASAPDTLRTFEQLAYCQMCTHGSSRQERAALSQPPPLAPSWSCQRMLEGRCGWWMRRNPRTRRALAAVRALPVWRRCCLRAAAFATMRLKPSPELCALANDENVGSFSWL